MSGANRFPGGNGNPGRHPAGGYGNQPGYGGHQGGEEDMYNQYGHNGFDYDEGGMESYNQGYYNQQQNYPGPSQFAKPGKHKRPNTQSNMEVTGNYSGGVAYRYPGEGNRKNYSNWKSSHLEQLHFDPKQVMNQEQAYDYGYGYSQQPAPIYGQQDESYQPAEQDAIAWDDPYGEYHDDQDYQKKPNPSSNRPPKKGNNNTSQRLSQVDVSSSQFESSKLELGKSVKSPGGKPAKPPAIKVKPSPNQLEMKSGPMMLQVGKKENPILPQSKTKEPSEKAHKPEQAPKDTPKTASPSDPAGSPSKPKKPKEPASNNSSGPLQQPPTAQAPWQAADSPYDDHQDLDLDLDDPSIPAPSLAPAPAAAAAKQQQPPQQAQASAQPDRDREKDKDREEQELSDAQPRRDSRRPAAGLPQPGGTSVGVGEELAAGGTGHRNASPKKNAGGKAGNKPPSGPLSRFGSDPLHEKSETNSNKNPRSQKNSQGLDPRLMATITEEGSKMSRGLKSRNNKESSAHHQSVRKLEAKGALEDFKNLNEGLYFKDESSPNISFLIHPRQEPNAWLDDYVINGIIITGIVLSVPSLSSVVYVFIDRTHEIYHRHFKTKDGSVSWRNHHIFTTAPCIGIFSSVERVELYENLREGYQGRCCFMVMSNCHLSYTSDAKTVKDWMDYQQVRLLYEPAMIPTIHVQTISKLNSPEDPLCKPTCVPVYFNPKTGELPVRFSHKLAHVDALDGDYCIGIIELLHGKYTMISHTRHIFFTLLRMAERALEVAEELGTHVCLHNARRFFVEDDKHNQVCVLIAPFEPLISLVRYSSEEGTDFGLNPETERLSSLLPMQDETINPVPILPDS